MKYITIVNEVEYDVELLGDGQIGVNGQVYQVDFSEIDGGQAFSLLVDGRSFEAFISDEEIGLQVIIEGVRYSTEVIDEHEKLLREAGGDSGSLDGVFELTAPMPGLIVKVPVVVGDHVKEGEVLVVLESMKMQNELKAPKEGVVTIVNVSPGDNVEKRDMMVALGPLDEDTNLD